MNAKDRFSFSKSECIVNSDGELLANSFEEMLQGNVSSSHEIKKSDGFQTLTYYVFTGENDRFFLIFWLK